MITTIILLLINLKSYGTNLDIHIEDSSDFCGNVLFGPVDRVDLRTARPSDNNLRDLNIEGEIRKQANENNIDPEIAHDVAACESEFRADVKNKKSSATGVFQFTRATFMEGIKNRGLDWEWSDVKDPINNIDMAMYYMKKGQYMRWRDCYLKSINN